MLRYFQWILLAGVALGMALRASAQQTPDPDSPRYKGVLALQDFLAGSGEESVKEFVEEKVSQQMLDKEGQEALLARLSALRKSLAQAQMRGARPEGPLSARIIFDRQGKQESIAFRVEAEPPHRFVEIRRESQDEGADEASGQAAVDETPARFSDRESLIAAIEGRMRREMAAGFSGSLLIARGDDVLLERGYGLADRERNIAVTPDTLFDVGSIAKLFTRVAMLKLQESGKLQLSDKLSAFFPKVPEDKADICISDLLDMRSGLHEYHDHSGDFEPLTRDQALERIWKQPLRFAPGTRRAYSNSGYAVLAAIVEVTSGVSYPQFLDRHLFEPAGMKASGFYQLRQWAPDSVAVGYGGRSHGKVNSPLYWPEISWACMGGGCLVSSSRELFGWYRRLAAGKILSSATLASAFSSQPGLRLSAGLNDFGFGAVVAEERSRGDLVIVLSNSAAGTSWEKLAPALAEMMGRWDGP